MPRPSYDELDANYRTAIRIAVQQRTRAESAEAQLLHVTGRLLALVQQVETGLELSRREHERQTTGHELDALASSDVRIPSH